MDLPLCKVLVVEDDYFVAQAITDACEDARCLVIGPVATENDAADILSHEVADMAIVDLNLGQGMNFGVAHMLREHGIPFCFATGYDQSVIPKEFAEIPHLQKPIDTDALLEAVRAVLGKGVRDRS